MGFSVPVPSQDKGGRFCGGLATHPGKTIICNRNDAENHTLFRKEGDGGARRKHSLNRVGEPPDSNMRSL